METFSLIFFLNELHGAQAPNNISSSSISKYVPPTIEFEFSYVLVMSCHLLTSSFFPSHQQIISCKRFSINTTLLIPKVPHRNSFFLLHASHKRLTDEAVERSAVDHYSSPSPACDRVSSSIFQHFVFCLPRVTPTNF